MRKSTIWTLVISIILIVLSFVLTAAGIYQSAQQVTYNYGFGYYRSVSFNGYSPLGHVLKSFGTMCFILGIAGMVLFTYLAVSTPGPRKKVDNTAKAKEKSESRAEQAERMKADAEDAQEVKVESVEDGRETNT